MGLPDPLALIAETNLTESDQQMIAGENANRLFGLDD
jgi:hypothetical protein